MSDPVPVLPWPEDEDSLAVTISELEHDLRSGSWDGEVVLARLGQIRDRAVMEEQAAARRAADIEALILERHGLQAEVARLSEVNGQLFEALAVRSDEEADPDWEEPIFNAPWQTGNGPCQEVPNVD